MPSDWLPGSHVAPKSEFSISPALAWAWNSQSNPPVWPLALPTQDINGWINPFMLFYIFYFPFHPIRVILRSLNSLSSISLPTWFFFHPGLYHTLILVLINKPGTRKSRKGKLHQIVHRFQNHQHPHVKYWGFVVMWRKWANKKNHKSNGAKPNKNFTTYGETLKSNVLIPFENLIKNFFSADNLYEARERCENLWEVHGSLSLLFLLYSSSLTCFLLNLSYERQAKVSITAFYSTIIYFPACSPSPFQCYHCWVNFPKATVCNSPKTTQPSQTFIWNSHSTIECNLWSDILGPWNLSFTSHVKSFLWKWFCHHCIALWQRAKGRSF